MSDRALMPDYLRFYALFGIVVVNVQSMAFPVLDGFDGAPRYGLIDAVSVWLVNGLAFTKTYGLFSFMFGVGLAYQMKAADRRSLPFSTLYRNRMLALIVLGFIHGCLFFPYDILLLYGVVGSLLYAVRLWSVRRLVIFGAALLLVQVLITAALMMAPTPPNELTRIEHPIMTGGGVWDVVAMRSLTFFNMLPFLFLFQGIAALGWFCLGLASVKSGLIDQAGHPLWARARRICLLPGVGMSLLGAALWEWGPQTEDAVVFGLREVGMVLTIVSSPIATLGYLGVIAALARPPSPFMGTMLQAGGSSLSIYLGQSIVLSTLFAPYGLALWGSVSPAGAVGLALLVTFVLVMALALWRMRFAQGPFEWLLRKVTRLGVKAAA